MVAETGPDLIKLLFGPWREACHMIPISISEGSGRGRRLLTEAVRAAEETTKA